MVGLEGQPSSCPWEGQPCSNAGYSPLLAMTVEDLCCRLNTTWTASPALPACLASSIPWGQSLLPMEVRRWPTCHRLTACLHHSTPAIFVFMLKSWLQVDRIAADPMLLYWYSAAGHNVVMEIQATLPSNPTPENPNPTKKPMMFGVYLAYGGHYAIPASTGLPQLLIKTLTSPGCASPAALVAYCYFGVAYTGYHAFGNATGATSFASGKLLSAAAAAHPLQPLQVTRSCTALGTRCGWCALPASASSSTCAAPTASTPCQMSACHAKPPVCPLYLATEQACMAPCSERASTSSAGPACPLRLHVSL